MSKQNVEVVRAWYDAWRRRDIQALFRFYDPAIVWDMTHALVPDMGTYHGHDGVREFFREWRTFFPEYDAEPEEFIDAGESVVVRVKHGGHSRASTIAGVETPAYYSEMPRFWQVFRVRDGRAVRVEIYRDEAEALEAVGLREWENAEQRGLAEAAFGALNAGDLEAFLALTAEDVEFTSMVAEAEGTIFRGHDGVRSWWETVRGAFEDVRWELLDIRGSGDRGVLHFRMAGTLGSVPVEQTMWQATVLRDGKVIWWAFFRSEREALEALGLPE